MLIDYDTIVLILDRIKYIVVSASAVIISLLWIPVALSFFTDDENIKYKAMQRLKNAAIGTIIYLMAATGTIYIIFMYIVTGRP
ncbi:hypothetical protein [Picrophilus oshimae]|uniref:Uncharacterized protein n=1 Tax=Picrophilus torridus (strain ATCC 700027 / DSM 9790 / JCM 10055 / NBRC 100828 / KAW 2/3) TaxID=1122961 RepID=Q6L0L5_PICTO|nr:hypothetical protein [Picrophilus oshimae]AAT43487.1 hypothetical protein PTO0902 [Picrophilus oshimae DSM 9789]